MSNRAGPHRDTYGLAPEVARLHLKLTTATDQHRPPCRGRAEWTSEARSDRADAVEGCSHCPHQQPCEAYAHAAGELHGVWAGRDRTDYTSTAPRRGRSDTSPRTTQNPDQDHDHEETPR